jgi:hypothetical protein
MSSPTNSIVTEKTLQSTPWEEDLEAMKQRNDASRAHSDTSKKSAREIALEEIVLKLNTTLQDKSKREEDLLTQLNKLQHRQNARKILLLILNNKQPIIKLK